MQAHKEARTLIKNVDTPKNIRGRVISCAHSWGSQLRPQWRREHLYISAQLPICLPKEVTLDIFGVRKKIQNIVSLCQYQTQSLLPNWGKGVPPSPPAPCSPLRRLHPLCNELLASGTSLGFHFLKIIFCCFLIFYTFFPIETFIFLQEHVYLWT